MNKNILMNLKEEHIHMEIPSELDVFIKAGIDQGRKKVGERNRKAGNLMKTCAAFFIALSLFAGGINASPSFAEAVKGMPLIGKLVSILQFKDGKSGGGTLTDGTDISDIGLTEEDVYERIVIEFVQGAELQSNVGSFSVRYEENPYTMTFVIGGARRISAKESFENILGSELVRDVYRIMTLDDSLIRFVIEFEGPVLYEVKEMKEPASIVLDFKKDEQSLEAGRYSLRTRSYSYGETIGMMEERLMRLGPTRVLKDAEGMHFVEIGLFGTEGEAQEKLLEIAGDGDFDLFIEERIGGQKPGSYPLGMEMEAGDEMGERNPAGKNGQVELAAGSASYDVSIYEGDNQYYGEIEVLEKGLRLSGDKAGVKEEQYFEYEDCRLIKFKGEASYKLGIENDGKTVVVSGVFLDFFAMLEERTSVVE